MLRKAISSALVLLAAAAAGALSVLAALPPANVHSHGSRPEAEQTIAPAPAIPERSFRRLYT
jgi:hypothetical protein